MCGIGGYYQTGSTENAPQWAKPALRKMWNSLQSRGTDASGVAYESPSGIRHVKTDKPAYELSSLGMNLAFGMNRSPRWLLLHTRASTHGKPERNRNNNHLMGNKLALCHKCVVYNKDNVFHMKRELGDICWYIAQACMALDTSFDEIIEMNVDKLKKRYPGGEFDVSKSENRKEGDL